MIIDLNDNYIIENELLVSKCFANYKEIYKYKPIKKNEMQIQCIIYILNSALVGSLSYYTEGDMIRLMKLAVDEQYRGMGIMSKMIKYISDKFIKTEYKELRLYTIKEADNVNYFIKRGFHILSERVPTDIESTNNSVIHEVEMNKKIV